MAKSNFEKVLEEYNYELPVSLIAQNPASPRDNARLLVYNRKTKEVFLDKFKNLIDYLPHNSVLVFNKTKVIPARLYVKKESGGKIELLYINHDSKYVYALSNKTLEPKTKLYLNQKIIFEVIGKKGKEYKIFPSFKTSKTFQILDKCGITPLPPYIKNSELNEQDIKKEYQAIFARIKGSVAAPTASLHFTKNLLKKIEDAGHKIYFITLHVNLGTFAPLTEEQFKDKKLHGEWFEMNKKTAEALNNAKEKGCSIISVGTTVTRTLESACVKPGKIERLSGTTNLFIDKNYELKFTDSVITNFHVPKSSLLMLVSAFTERETLFNLYNLAIKKNFRFFSFGDGMFIK